MAAQMLKAKYYLQKEFLRVKLKPGSSYVWRSLIWGRELQCKGLCWSVGDGASIDAFQNPWIPRPLTFKPVSCAPAQNIRASSFINANGGWDLTRLEESILETDRDAILSIALGVYEEFVQTVLVFDKKGLYSVKSGYRLTLETKLQSLRSSSILDSKWWLCLWNLNIPPKVRIYVWKVCHNVIPSFSNLRARKVMGDPCCKRCFSGAETISHAFFWCKNATDLLKKTVF
ncbi:hypothetical protein ACOSQ3_005364 [Xanthoceras sorbifolium]